MRLLVRTAGISTTKPPRLNELDVPWPMKEAALYVCYTSTCDDLQSKCPTCTFSATRVADGGPGGIPCTSQLPAAGNIIFSYLGSTLYRVAQYGLTMEELLEDLCVQQTHHLDGGCPQ